MGQKKSKFIQMMSVLWRLIVDYGEKLVHINISLPKFKRIKQEFNITHSKNNVDDNFILLLINLTYLWVR